jgi:hypothetical protein
VATWEDRFRSWAGGPGDTELERCQNAERMIRKALAQSSELKRLDIEVFSQGSFRNVTNIPQESDIDISACLKSTEYFTLPDGATASDFGISPSTFDYASYKKAVADAIKAYFGSENVTVGNKAILVHSNTYRVDADVVANLISREYFDVSKPSLTRTGVKFLSDDGKVIVNYPKQHIEQGVTKNSTTSKRFKRIARILKSLQVEMLDEKLVADRRPSFFLESLAYNVPDGSYGHGTYEADVRAVLAHIYNKTRPEDDASKWTEVNGVKYLFHESQPWTKAQANAFVLSAWRYVGFK